MELAGFAIFVAFLAILTLLPLWWPKKRIQSCSEDYCSSRRDPRCVAGNCTYHCNYILGCKGYCIEVWKNSKLAEQLVDSVFDKRKEKV